MVANQAFLRDTSGFIEVAILMVTCYCQGLILDARRIRKDKNLVLDLSTGLPPPRISDCRLVACLISGKKDKVGSFDLAFLSCNRSCSLHVTGSSGGAAEASELAKQLVQASWRGSTEEQYGSCWARWLRYCRRKGISEYSPALAHVMNYLAELFSEGLAYRTVNTHRSALSSTLKSIDGHKVGQHPVVCRLMKGIFNKRPPIQKLVNSWSVDKVLKLIKSWGSNEKLDLKYLSFKTAMLVALASARRCSSLVLFSVKQGFFSIGESVVKFQPVGLEKQSRESHIAPPLELHSFEDSLLDPVASVREYVNRTKNLRSSEQLFVVTSEPYKAASKVTIAAWLSKVIEMSGQEGTAGSVRSVASSMAMAQGASLEAVLNAGDWARQQTFKRFYYKPVPLSFQDAVLS